MITYNQIKKEENVLDDRSISALSYWLDCFDMESKFTTGESRVTIDPANAPSLLRPSFTTEVASISENLIYLDYESQEVVDKEKNLVYEIKMGVPLIEEHTVCVKVKSLEMGIPHIVSSNLGTVSQDVKEFSSLHGLLDEINQLVENINNSFLYDKLEIELVSDYETDFQQICFSIHMKISYDDLANLRESFYQKLFQLNMPIEKEKYFVFDFEREEP